MRQRVGPWKHFRRGNAPVSDSKRDIKHKDLGTSEVTGFSGVACPACCAAARGSWSAMVCPRCGYIVCGGRSTETRFKCRMSCGHTGTQFGGVGRVQVAPEHLALPPPTRKLLT
jgi:hypothetical protein